MKIRAINATWFIATAISAAACVGGGGGGGLLPGADGGDAPDGFSPFGRGDAGDAGETDGGTDEPDAFVPDAEPVAMPCQTPEDCASPLTCVAMLCVLPVAGDGTCASPIDVSESGVFGGRNDEAASSHVGRCAGDGAELVHRLSVDEAKTVRLSTEGSMYDTVLYVRTACETADSEIACNDDAVAATSELWLEAEPDVDYFVFVDGFDPMAVGEYVLDVDIGASLPPAPCETPIRGEVGVVTGRVTGPSRTAGTCGGEGGAERAVEFTAPVTDTFQFDASGSTFEPVLYSRRLCAAPGAETMCSGGSLVLDLEQGQTVHVFVDAVRGAGEWTLQITALGSPCLNEVYAETHREECGLGEIDCDDPEVREAHPVACSVADTCETADCLEARSEDLVCGRFRGAMSPTPAPAFQAGVGGACDPGRMSDTARVDAVDVVNMGRWLAGLRPVTEAVGLRAGAQECAMIMASNGNLSHEPPPDWTCWTQAGAQAASESNIGIRGAGAPVPESTLGFYRDGGANNLDRVGHRRWFQDPGLRTVGFGLYETAGGGGWQGICANVIGGASDDQWIGPPFVGYPSPGFFPREMLVRGDEFLPWSVSIPASFRDTFPATERLDIRVTRLDDGSDVPLGHVNASGDWIGSSHAAVFVPQWQGRPGRYRVAVSAPPAIDVVYETEIVSCGGL